MTLSCIMESYVTPFTPIIAAVIVYFLGRKAYYSQKEYELVASRYLEEGLDSISKNVDKSLAIFRHNWWQSTVVLKHFRDLGKDIRPELIEGPYISPDPSLFEIWRDYRLKEIVGDDIFNKAHQSLDAFVRSSYAFFQDDIGAMLRVAIEGGKELEVKTPRNEMIAEYISKVKELYQDAKRYYGLLGELQVISTIIQTERFNFRKLKQLKNRSEIQESISRLKDAFADVVNNNDEATEEDV